MKCWIVTLLALGVLPCALIQANPVTHTRTLTNVDYVVAGIAGVGGGSGTITVAGVTGSVTQAFLYWHGMNNSGALAVYANATVSINGNPVTGLSLGDATTNCWGAGSSRAFEANVTAFVTGNGSYAITGLSNGTGHNANGASLVVIFNDGNSANNRDLAFFTGNDSNNTEGFPGETDGWHAVLTPITYNGGPVRANLHVADGQAFLDNTLTFNTGGPPALVISDSPTLWDGNSLPTAGTSRASNGQLWDIHTFDITAAFGPTGSVTLNLDGQAFVGGDCLGLVLLLLDLEPGSAPPPTTPPVISSLCGPSSPPPARISGSTGAQGVLDPTNTDSTQGIRWPPNAVGAGIDLETGQVVFIDSTGAELPDTVTLPGVSGFPAFPDGKLHFTSVHLPPGKGVLIFTERPLPPELVAAPAIILSCQDVIVEGNGDGTLANNGAIFALVGNFAGGFSGALLANPAGFGPRSASKPATGSLYPPVPGGGGNGGTGIPIGQTVSQTLRGGEGGGALVIAAAGRITVNGLVAVNPDVVIRTLPNITDGGPLLDGEAASSSSSVAQGGAGGSVRLAAVLVEGIGKIDTSGGKDSDGVKRSLDGPIEIQAFVQDLFAGTTTTTPIRGKPVVEPLPGNLPEIGINSVSFFVLPQDAVPTIFSVATNTGSVVTPDVTLPESSSPVFLELFISINNVNLSTEQLLDGTSLTVRAVGTNGKAVEVAGTVDCVEGCFARATFTDGNKLDPGATYQIVVTPATPFALPLVETGNGFVVAGVSSPLHGLLPRRKDAAPAPPVLSGLSRAESRGVEGSVSGRASAAADSAQLAERWARAFGVEPNVPARLARVTVTVGSE